MRTPGRRISKKRRRTVDLLEAEYISIAGMVLAAVYPNPNRHIRAVPISSLPVPTTSDASLIFTYESWRKTVRYPTPSYIST